MSLYINIDEFRQFYSDAIACKMVLNENAHQMLDDEKRFDALMPTIDTFGHEMVKKLIANAILADKEAYDEKIREWAENTPVRKFFYETNEVLEKYVPKFLTKEILEKIALDLIDRENHKNIVMSADNLQFEIVKSIGSCYLLAHENEAKQTLYLACKDMPNDLQHTPFFSENISDVFIRYQDALEKYNIYTKIAAKDDAVYGKLLQEYNDFRDEMLSKDPKDIFESAYKIACIEDLFFILTENMDFTKTQKDYVINNEESTLLNLYNEWNDTDFNHTQEMTDTINDFFNDELMQTQGGQSEDDEDIEL